MRNISGITGCGPLFRDVMLLLERENPGKVFHEPDNLIRVKICLQSGRKATLSCPGHMEEIFFRGTEPFEYCPFDHAESMDNFLINKSPQKSERAQLRILFPMDGDIFKLDPVLRKSFQTIRFKASIPDGLNPNSMEWWLDGEKTGESLESISWNLKPGTHNLSFKIPTKETWIQSPLISFTVLQ